MLIDLCLIVASCVQVVHSYSIFGGNAYGYTGNSWCAMYNGCMAQSAEDENGRPKHDYRTSGGTFSDPRQSLCWLNSNAINNAKKAPSIMQINHYTKAEGYNLFHMRKFFYNCLAGYLDYITDKTHLDECEVIKSDKILQTRIDEIFKYQILNDDMEILENSQGAIWRWSVWQYNKLSYIFNTSEVECDLKCKEALRQTCREVYLIRHVKAWCANILKWVFSNDYGDLDKYQHFLLKLVEQVLAHHLEVDEEDGYISNEEKAVLIASAGSTIFISRDMFQGLEKVTYLDRLPWFCIHSLFLATYVGRLRITLQPKPANWNGGGLRVPASDSSIEEAANFEQLTGSVYASIAALFTNKVKKKLKLRFRPEIHAPNNIGCIEQTVGMAFIRPADWIPDHVMWKSMGPSGFSPAGMMAVAAGGMESTLEITEGGLTMYPVTIAALLLYKQESICNMKDTMGNGKAAHYELNLKGLGGVCNWVPTW